MICMSKKGVDDKAAKRWCEWLVMSTYGLLFSHSDISYAVEIICGSVIELQSQHCGTVLYVQFVFP